MPESRPFDLPQVAIAISAELSCCLARRATGARTKTPDPDKPALSRDVWVTGGVPDENAQPSSIVQYGSEAFANQREVLL